MQSVEYHLPYVRMKQCVGSHLSYHSLRQYVGSHLPCLRMRQCVGSQSLVSNYAIYRVSLTFFKYGAMYMVTPALFQNDVVQGLICLVSEWCSSVGSHLPWLWMMQCVESHQPCLRIMQCVGSHLHNLIMMHCVWSHLLCLRMMHFVESYLVSAGWGSV